MTLSPGRRLGPYQIEDRIGAGGMGEVYRALDTRLGRQVAIKLLPPEFATDAELRVRFDREARTIATLSHPNICSLYDVGDGYLVMELLSGETLAARLSRGALPVAEAVHTSIQIAMALDAAHRSGVIHRDLKPGNVMLTNSGVKLFDFGLAREIRLGLPDATTRQDPLTASGAIIGTLPYMSPEQVDGKPADARSDIFGLGSILYEMLTGRRAFEAASQAGLIVAILSEDPPDLSQISSLFPPALDHVVRRCLEKKAEARWQSASDVARELEFAISPDPPGRPWRRRPVRRRPLAVAGAVILAGAIAGVVAGHLRQASAPAIITRSSIELPAGWSLDPSTGPLMSPDGSRVAFIALDARGVTSLWLRRVDSLTATQVEGTSGISFVSWSPDGRHVLFGTASRLNRADVDGHDVTTIGDTSDPRGATENQRGDIVFAPTYTSAPLMRASVHGGKPVPITRLASGETTHRWPQFLPDGDHVLFFAADGTPGRQEIGRICVTSLATGKTERLLDASSHAVFSAPDTLFASVEGSVHAWAFDPKTRAIGARLSVLPDIDVNEDMAYTAASASRNALLVYLSRAARPMGSLQWFNRRGEPLEVIGQPASFEDLKLSPDGSRLAVARDGDIWIYDLRRGIPTRATFGRTVDRNPVWSPDGGTLAYNSSRPGKYETRLKPASSVAAPDRAIEDASSPFCWSPDGRYVVLASGTTPLTKILLYSVATSSVSLYVDDSFGYGQAALSPDGKWLAFISNISGSFELYVDTFPVAGHRIQISEGNAWWPRWRSDGKELFYVGPDHKLMAVAVHADSQRFDSEPARRLFQFSNGVALENTNICYDVTSDGQRFILITRAGQQRHSMTLVTNWKSDLGER